MGDQYYNDDRDEEDDGFEDCVPGGLRPNYKIPILLSELKEEVIDEILQSENNVLSCAACDFRFTDFRALKTHFETCSGKPSGKAQEYEISQFHTNSLILALKNMFEAATSGLSETKTDTRLPFHMEPFAGVHMEHLAIVTCRMCKCQFAHRAATSENRGTTLLTEEEQDIDPSLIKYHVKLCPEYESDHNQFMTIMAPYIEKVRYHYDKVFSAYKVIRSGIYGSNFKIRTIFDPFSWREMGTIYEVDESNRGLLRDTDRGGQPLRFRIFDFKLHNIEPENVDFIRTDYYNHLAEMLDNIFFTRVTGLEI